MFLSAVIPVMNEAASLRQLHAEITTALSGLGPLQIIYVDDGSKDDSWQVIQELAAQHSNTLGIRFRRNFGKAAALDAGFQAATGQFVVTLDADLQDDPADVPNILSLAQRQELDLVSGWKQIRHDPWHKVLPSRIFNAMVSALTGVKLHDHNCGLKLYRREVVQELHLYGEMHRFVPVLADARGFRVGEMAIHHRPRLHGKSKYGWRRLIKGFLDLLTVKFLVGFGQRPQHLLGTVGLVCFAVGFLGLTYLTGYWLAAQAFPQWKLLPLHTRPAVLYSLGALLLGGQLFSLGFLAELITAKQAETTRAYSIRTRTDQTARDDTTQNRDHATDNHNPARQADPASRGPA